MAEAREETTALGMPCLTLRENTERPITVVEGTNTLVTVGDLEEAVAAVLGGRGKKGKVPALWDGKAAERIVEVLAQIAWRKEHRGKTVVGGRRSES